MNDKIKELLAKAAKLEASEDHEQLAEVYRELARLYHKAKNKEKNEEFLAKVRAAKEKIEGTQAWIQVINAIGDS